MAQPRSLPAELLVIGLGNPHRGDDGVGRLVARLLRDRAATGMIVEEQDGSAVDLLDRLRDADRVILIDAAVTGAPAGTIHAIDCNADAAAIPARGAASSHGLGVAEALALARLLHGLPRSCLLYAIEGLTFDPGGPMSPAVAAAAELLAGRLGAG
jgi:hydrogenase maturation protease